jgi:hypothetical protein
MIGSTAEFVILSAAKDLLLSAARCHPRSVTKLKHDRSSPPIDTASKIVSSSKAANGRIRYNLLGP